MKTIIWDVDDVLNDLMGRWLEDVWLPDHPTCAARYEELQENPPCGIIGCSLEEYLSSLDRFRLEAAAGLEPDLQVVEWFLTHGHRFHHVALTAVPLAAAHVSAGWVMRHFGPWIRSFAVVPTARPGAPEIPYHRSKGDYLSWLGKGDVLVDDDPHNVTSARSLGLHGMLVPRPWNQGSGTLSYVLAELAQI